jgi:small neutral amino acid transporter SnatA (MarC family)
MICFPIACCLRRFSELLVVLDPIVVVPCVIKKFQESGEDEANSVMFTSARRKGRTGILAVFTYSASDLVMGKLIHILLA